MLLSLCKRCAKQEHRCNTLMMDARVDCTHIPIIVLECKNFVPIHSKCCACTNCKFRDSACPAHCEDVLYAGGYVINCVHNNNQGDN